MMEPLRDLTVLNGVCRKNKTELLDLCGQRSIEECRNMLQTSIALQQDEVVLVGHSGGAQVATHFLHHPAVKLVVGICPPSHNPLRLPFSLWSKTLAHLKDTSSVEPFGLSDPLSKELFGRNVPAEMVSKTSGTLMRQFNLGFLGGNPAPPKRQDWCAQGGAELLLFSSGSDPLISVGAVRSTAVRLDGFHFQLTGTHLFHYPHIPTEAGETWSMVRIVEEMMDADYFYYGSHRLRQSDGSIEV